MKLLRINLKRRIYSGDKLRETFINSCRSNCFDVVKFYVHAFLNGKYGKFQYYIKRYS